MKANPQQAPFSHELTTVLAEVRKAFGKDALMRLGDEASQAVDTLPTGSLALDAALGIGGYPRGRIIEIYGPESSGKTTLTLHAIAEAQRAGGVAAFVDAEHAFDLRYARGLGIDIGSLLVSQPDCGEQALDITEMLARSGAVSLIVVDSVAALVPRAELEGDMGDNHLGLQARLMSQALRKLAALAHRSHTTLIFINQLRQKIGVVFGSPEVTAGGNALKYFSSVRLDVRRIGKVTDAEATVGSRTRVKVVKNKCAPPFAEAEFDIRWGTGIDRAQDTIETALLYGVIEKHGAHLHFRGKSIGLGRERAREAVLANPELAADLVSALRSAARSSALPSANAAAGAADSTTGPDAEPVAGKEAA